MHCAQQSVHLYLFVLRQESMDLISRIFGKNFKVYCLSNLRTPLYLISMLRKTKTVKSGLTLIISKMGISEIKCTNLLKQRTNTSIFVQVRNIQTDCFIKKERIYTQFTLELAVLASIKYGKRFKNTDGQGGLARILTFLWSNSFEKTKCLKKTDSI